MAVCAIFDVRGGTQEQYERIVAQVGEQMGGAPAGLLSHVAGPTEGGWHVVELWESEEAAQAAWQRYVMPAAEAAGFPPARPTIFTVHAQVAA